MGSEDSKLPKILLIGTGGTITAQKIDQAWSPGKFTEEDLLQFIPEIRKLAEIDTTNLFNIDSVCMQPKYWVKIAETIRKEYDNYQGFVITHGTDTLHYTASSLSFLMQNLTKPVVLTGSMVPPHVLGTDAWRNLTDAIRVAVETKIHEVLIVFNRKILRGNRTKKFREVEFDAYQSIGMQPIGIVEQDIRYSGVPYFSRDQNEKPIFYDKMELEVCIQKITPGYNPEIIAKLREIGYKGIVTEGFGSGNIPIYENSLIKEIEQSTRAKIPVIVCSQCAIGFSWMDLYESGKMALIAGAIPGYDMIAETAMTKLMWILGNFPNLTMEEIRAKVLEDVSGEISSIKTPKEKRAWEYAF
ncbi:MAG: L-asparaginase 1 [Promethearchaeia archaeon]|nr:MAG: L-asparaginase 1 [Candidatus Lokiarchaeia archaeon]